MSSIKSHPQYPFLRIGLAYDIYPEWANYPDGVIDNDWHIVVGDKALSGEVFHSEEDALAKVEVVLFQPWNDELVEEQIRLAQESGDFPLMRRLIEGLAWAEGYRQAEKDIAKRLEPLYSGLAHVMRTAGFGPY